MPKNRVPLVGLEAAIRVKTPQMISEMAERLYAKMYENTSVTDGHTLRVLDLMGNPYGKISPQEIHDPEYIVHHQATPSSAGAGNNNGEKVTGPGGDKRGVDLIDGLRINIINQYRIQVGFDEAIVPHVADLYWGTTIDSGGMRGRDFIEGSFREVQEELQQIGDDGLKEIVEKGAIG